MQKGLFESAWDPNLILTVYKLEDGYSANVVYTTILVSILQSALLR